MRLDEALQLIAQAAGLDAAALVAYAAEDHVGGRDTGDWAAMSVHQAEGQVLYALVRALQPKLAVEVGVDSGGTSTHILSAMERNGKGRLFSVDLKAECGINVPESLRHRWQFVVGDALQVELPERADFVFEDGAHSYDFTLNMLLRLKALNPRVIVSHDYFSHEVYGGFEVKRAFDETLPGGFGVKPDDAFTGLGVWVNAEWAPPVDIPPYRIGQGTATPTVTSDESGLVETDAGDPAAAPKPRRKAARRA